MRYLIFFFLIAFEAGSTELNLVEREFYLSIDGVDQQFKNGEKKKVSINGKNVEITFSIGELKSFSNYGVSFSVPQNTSAYIDESTLDYDIWNFDYHDSVMILFVFKSQFEISNELVIRQLKRVANNLNMEVSDIGESSISNKDLIGVSAIGTLGKHEFLLEEFGFSTNSNSFMIFYYSPLIERKSRNVDEIYKYFKSVINSTLEY